jgi:hypothetical protein
MKKIYIALLVLGLVLVASLGIWGTRNKNKKNLTIPVVVDSTVSYQQIVQDLFIAKVTPDKVTGATDVHRYITKERDGEAKVSEATFTAAASYTETWNYYKRTLPENKFKIISDSAIKDEEVIIAAKENITVRIYLKSAGNGITQAHILLRKI